ncbi:MAG TPA: thermonuclease family protein [Azospirillaceae bacterium]|nr:thermonuclease family protein [Azospirillaceae bacterium]
MGGGRDDAPSRRLILGLLAALPALGTRPLAAAPLPDTFPADGLVPLDGGAVTGVGADGSLTLADGRTLRLAGIQLPRPASGNRRIAAWPLAGEAAEALAGLVRGRTVIPHAAGAARDRHGRIPAQLVRDDGLWVQGEMLRLGWARLHFIQADRLPPAPFRAAEAEARAAAAGLWAHPFYAVRSPDAVAGEVGSFQLVAGRVARTARVRDWIYVNFGRDYRSDFTVEVAAADHAAFRAAGLDPLALGGRRVEVRGWIEDRNGPLVHAAHPGQLALLE